MKNLLLPTDFSEEANNAFALALQLAKKNNARLHLLHCATVPIDWIHLSNQEKMYQDVNRKINHAQYQLNMLRENAEKEGIITTAVLSYQDLLKTINQDIEDKHIDLLIMGSKGASGFKEFLIGSNTEKLIRHAGCPVLTVKEAISLQDVKKILFPTDLAPNQIMVAKYAARWAELLGAKLCMAKLNTHYQWIESLKFVKEIETFASQCNINSFEAMTFDTDYLEDGIIEAADKVKADLIVMGTHHRTGVAHIIAGSVAEDVANHAKRLILTVGLE